MQELYVYNTLWREKQKFVPINPDEVTMYTCGPTVYNYAHIGNLRAYVFADILKKTLIYFGYNVKHIINITDVGHLVSDADTGEDKLEKWSEREWKSAWDIAEYYTKEFKKDLKAMNIMFPTKFTHATKYIAEQINMIKLLEEKGYTYIIEDGVYMDTSKVSDYGKLLWEDYKKALDWLNAGERVDMAGKKNKTDFALWKFSPKWEKRQMEWDSPWWKGFPWWHIECSAMSSTELWETIDIHNGGIDHIPVHHTNEIAQSECATAKKFVNYWMHNEFLNLKDMKMSKSSGDFVRIQTLLDRKISPLVYRFYLLNSHYRKQLIFTWELLEEAEKNYYKLKKLIKEKTTENWKSVIGDCDGDTWWCSLRKYKLQVDEALADDLNTPKVFATIWTMLKDNTIIPNKKIILIEKVESIFSLWLLDFTDIVENKLEIPEEVIDLAEQRKKFKQEKNFASADDLRQKIQALGFDVKDTREWYKIINYNK